MNKYQEAYKLASNLTPKDMLDKKVREAVDLVKEACDKAEKYDEKETPKKPLRFKDKFYISPPKCPICKTIPHTGNQKYCDECGQKLDWSDEDDK